MPRWRPAASRASFFNAGKGGRSRYSMTPLTPAVEAAFGQTAKNFNQILPDGIKTTFKTISIVELGFAGNVLREVHRISLDDATVLNVATGETTQLAT